MAGIAGKSGLSEALGLSDYSASAPEHFGRGAALAGAAEHILKLLEQEGEAVRTAFLRSGEALLGESPRSS